MKYKFGNVDKISFKMIEAFLSLWNQETKKLWNQEAKNPWNQQTKALFDFQGRESPAPLNIPTPTPARLNLPIPTRHNISSFMKQDI